MQEILGMVVKSRTFFFVVACFCAASVGFSYKNTATDASSEPVEPVPLNVALDERIVALGDKLFHDPRL